MPTGASVPPFHARTLPTALGARLALSSLGSGTGGPCNICACPASLGFGITSPTAASPPDSGSRSAPAPLPSGLRVLGRQCTTGLYISDVWPAAPPHGLASSLLQSGIIGDYGLATPIPSVYCTVIARRQHGALPVPAHDALVNCRRRGQRRHQHGRVNGRARP